MIAIPLLTVLASVLVLVLSAIQWGAAQRRELIYFHLTLEKPVSDYFREARASRQEYSRLAVAALILASGDLLHLVRSIEHIRAAYYAAGAGADHWLEVLGLGLLAYALLYPMYSQRLSLPWLAAAVVSVAGVGMGVSVLTLFHPEYASTTTRALILSVDGARIAQAVVALSTLAAAVAWRGERVALLRRAYALWLVGPVTSSPWLDQAAMVLFYLVLAQRVFRDVLDRYEALETNHHRLQRQREVIVGFLEQIGSAYNAALNLEEVLRIVVSAAVRTSGAGAGAIFLLDYRTQELQVHALEGPFPPLYLEVPVADLKRRWDEIADAAQQQRFALGQGIIGEVAVSGKARRVADARTAGILSASIGDRVRRHPMLIVPLGFRHEVLGVMAVINKRGAEEFSEEDQFLLSALVEQAAFYVENARMVSALATQERVQRELQIARDIQRLLLPTDSPNVPGFDLRALGRPALEMGGDYYDFFWVDRDLLGIVVADVSGKGVPAALTMAMLRTVMRTHAGGNPSVRDVLVRANTTLSADLRLDTFVSVFYGILDLRGRVLSWARVGHEPLVLLRGGAAQLLTPAGVAVGLLPPAEFEQGLEVAETRLAPGDTVVLYTDGITEAMNVEGEEFGSERFLAALRPGERLASSERIRCVDEAVQAFAGEAPQQDDITLVVLSCPEAENA